MARSFHPQARVASARHAVERAARAAVPRLADFCFIHVRSRAWLKGVAAAHVTAQGDRDVRALMRARRIAVTDEESTVARVVRTGRPVLRATVPPDPVAAPNGDRSALLLRRLAPRSVLVVPIAAGKTVLGAVSLCYADSGRTYLSRDLPPARRIARQIAATLVPDAPAHAPLRLRATARHAGHGPVIRRRVAARE